MRLFIAIDVDSNFFEDLQDRIEPSNLDMKKVNYFHFTLKFLGEVNDIEAVKKRLNLVKFNSFEIKIDNIGWFPSKEYIKVIWAGVEEDTNLIDLQQKVDGSLRDVFGRNKNFHPHVTIARVAFVRKKQRLIDNLNSLIFNKESFKIDSFKLMKSTLTRNGPIYETIEEYKAL